MEKFSNTIEKTSVEVKNGDSIRVLLNPEKIEKTSVEVNSETVRVLIQCDGAKIQIESKEIVFADDDIIIGIL